MPDVHELTHDDPELDEGKGDGAHGGSRARDQDATVIRRAVYHQVDQGDGDDDEPGNEEPLVGREFHLTARRRAWRR